MLIRIPAVLNREQLLVVNDLLATAGFADGRRSAGAAAQRVKSNEEIAAESAQYQPLNNIVMNSLVRHPVYLGAALPNRIAAPFYARYLAGMEYGPHVDDPVMGDQPRYRSDLAITVFLSDPQSYSGGELVVRTAFGEQFIKYAAGDAVMYPSSSRHRVAPVTEGVRLVAVTWVQSLIRDPVKRELLYELHQARESMLKSLPDSRETQHVDTAYVNLVRMWAEL